jgi:hypothetical protein
MSVRFRLRTLFQNLRLNFFLDIMVINIEVTSTRPSTPLNPVEFRFFVRHRGAQDEPHMMTRLEYKTCKSLEPKLYPGSYKEYVEAFTKYKEHAATIDYSLDKVPVTRRDYDKNCADIEAREDFVGWVHSPKLFQN